MYAILQEVSSDRLAAGSRCEIRVTISTINIYLHSQGRWQRPLSRCEIDNKARVVSGTMDIPYKKLEKIGAGSFSTVYKGFRHRYL
jgi:hypothetical protein